MKSGSSYYGHLESLSKNELLKLLCKTRRASKPPPFKSSRTIALRLSYDGRNYSGVQHHLNIRSVEDELLTAVRLTGIGADDWQETQTGDTDRMDTGIASGRMPRPNTTDTPNSSRCTFCGRTDAGVSAIAMVVSLRVKSRLDEPNRAYELAESDRTEYPYDKMLNEKLPDDIRVTGWASVPDAFSARYSCVQRYYRYYFTMAGMDPGRIQEATERLGRMTNFYRLSTHSNPRAVYDRRIDEMYVSRADARSDDESSKSIFDQGENRPSRGDGLYCLHIKARGFLHNMVRKMVWVIGEYGRGGPFSLERVNIAAPEPLVFVAAKYPERLNFIGNRFSEPAFRGEYDSARIACAIARLRLDGYDG